MCYGWGEGDDHLWLSGRGAIGGCHCRLPLSVLWLNGRGAIAGCHCSVRWSGGRVTTNFGGVDVVGLQCAMVGGEGDDQLWRSGRGAIAGCHCSVVWLGGG